MFDSKIRIYIKFYIRIHELILQNNRFWRLPWSFKKFSCTLDSAPTSGCRVNGRYGMDSWSQTLYPGLKVAHLNSNRGFLHQKYWGTTSWGPKWCFREEPLSPGLSPTMGAHTLQKGRPPFLFTMWHSPVVWEDVSNNPQWLCTAGAFFQAAVALAAEESAAREPIFSQSKRGLRGRKGLRRSYFGKRQCIFEPNYLPNGKN